MPLHATNGTTHSLCFIGKQELTNVPEELANHASLHRKRDKEKSTDESQGSKPLHKTSESKAKKTNGSSRSKKPKEGEKQTKEEDDAAEHPSKIHKEKKLTYPRNLHKRQQPQTSKTRPKITLQHHYRDYNSSVGIHGFPPATIYADQSLSAKSLKGKDDLDRGVAPFSRQGTGSELNP